MSFGESTADVESVEIAGQGGGIEGRDGNQLRARLLEQFQILGIVEAEGGVFEVSDLYVPGPGYCHAFVLDNFERGGASRHRHQCIQVDEAAYDLEQIASEIL